MSAAVKGMRIAPPFVDIIKCAAGLGEEDPEQAGMGNEVQSIN